MNAGGLTRSPDTQPLCYPARVISGAKVCVCVCASVPYVPYLYNTHEIIHVYTQMCNTITHTYRCIYVIVKYIFVFAMHFMHFYVIYATITWVIKKH